MTLDRLRGPICALIFLFLACAVLPYPGIQTDEALFAGAYYQDYAALDGFWAFKHHVPTMLISYLGALKTWLYYPIFKLFTPNVWSLRLPVALLGAGSVWCFTIFLRRLHGERAAWFGGLLLATDPIFIQSTTFDWGPVALQHFLFLAAGVLLLRSTSSPPSRPSRPAFVWDGAWCLAFFLLGLALWNKALAVWTFAGLLLPLLALFPGAVKNALTVRRCALALAFFAIGSFPFLRFNVRQPAATVHDNVKITTAELAPKARLLYETLRGYALMEYIAYEPREAQRWTYVPYALLAAMILLLIWPSRLGWYPLAAGAIMFLLMAITRNAGGAVHHLVLIWPLQYWAIAAAFAIPWRVRGTAPLAVAVVLLLALDNARVLNIYRSALIAQGSPGSWNNAIFPLAARIKALNPKTVRVYDWGMSDNLLLLTERRAPFAWNDRPYQAEIFADLDDLWIGTLRPFEAFANVNRDLQQAAADAGYDRQVVETVSDRQGRPVFELFQFAPKR